MSITRLYSGDDGQAHFEDIEIPQGVGAVYTIPIKPGTNLTIYRREEKERGFHTIPYPDFLLVLSGKFECSVGDGTKRTLEPGDLLLAEDLTGQGHTSKYIGPFTSLNGLHRD